MVIHVQGVKRIYIHVSRIINLQNYTLDWSEELQTYKLSYCSLRTFKEHNIQ